ncbi:tRNA U-34 5-methylaminomethyl-2-thiouridine biosynthesis protein [Gracilibacillus sp. D59]|uniref:tRNA U-34 5-methylaminomethyl-2-thiouridine biosynthesis protein n=1 Tax=Gracilibacillus sp. D59 TaxID=3457434 RepID=UPI003FCD59FA
MKDMLLAILGIIVAWAVWGFFTNDFSTPLLFGTILAISVGFSIGKKDKGKEITNH